MNESNLDNNQNNQTLEHLLSVIEENREKRCAEIGARAQVHVDDILHQAHTRVRARLRRHITILRENRRARVTAAEAKNQTLLRRQHQQADKVFLDTAWPMLYEALQALWNDAGSRRLWLSAVVTRASSILLELDWNIEHPWDFTEEEQKRLKQRVTQGKGKTPMLIPRDDIPAGIRIIAGGTVLDATLDGLQQQRTVIEAILIARVK